MAMRKVTRMMMGACAGLSVKLRSSSTAVAKKKSSSQSWQLITARVDGQNPHHQLYPTLCPDRHIIARQQHCSTSACWIGQSPGNCTSDSTSLDQSHPGAHARVQQPHQKQGQSVRRATLCSFMEEVLCRMGCVSRAPSRALMTEQRWALRCLFRLALPASTLAAGVK